MRHVMVPSTYEADQIPIPVDRVARRTSLLVCISADGSYLRPLLILPRKTIESELIEQGISEAHAKMVYQEHGFISTALFEEWCLEVFFPELEARRQHLGYWGEAVLILDGLCCHDSDGLQDE
jgi:hypothetical protein